LTQVKQHNVHCPYTIVELNLNIPLKYKEKCIEEIYRIGDSMDNETNVKATMSSWKIWKESKVFHNLINVIGKQSAYYFIKDKRAKITLHSAWSAIYKKGNYTKRHQHVPSFVSFVYYLKSSGETPLVFDDVDFQINPKDDTLVIFPSHIYHSVPIHESEEDRICLAGNFLMII
tara:strand:- start:71 stop:592 length:522 start_codon:yes stop_codon:yes gene_type:complete